MWEEGTGSPLSVSDHPSDMVSVAGCENRVESSTAQEAKKRGALRLSRLQLRPSRRHSIVNLPAARSYLKRK